MNEFKHILNTSLRSVTVGSVKKGYNFNIYFMDFIYSCKFVIYYHYYNLFYEDSIIE